MTLDRLVPHVGAAACLVLAAVLSAPYFLVDAQPELLTAYYGAGPVGVVAAVFLSVLGVVIFLSGVRGRADPALVSGIMLAVGVTIFLLTVLWAVTLEAAIVENVLALDPSAGWLSIHRWLAAATAFVVGAAAALYAHTVV
ncbi:MAG: DUF7548 family protein [Haloferacaceae archaeon]